MKRTLGMIIACAVLLGSGPAVPPSLCGRVDVEAGVGFLHCADGASAVVTHGLAQHCVASPDGLPVARRITCDDGLELTVMGGADGECTVRSPDVPLSTQAVPCTAYDEGDEP